MEVLQLVIARDAARRQVERSLEREDGRKHATSEAERPRRVRARAASAAALRSLAERLEPSPT